MIKIARFITVSLLLLLPVSCIKVGPDFKKPCPKKQCDWLESGEYHVFREQENLQEWWKVFQDPVLDRLINTALAQNLTLKGSGMRILEARALLGIAIGELFPQEQFADGSALKVELSKNTPNTALADLTYSNYKLGFRAIWELDFWGKFRRAIESAQSEYFASVENYGDVKVLLLGDVAATYVAFRTAQERIVIVEKNVKTQSRSLEIVDARFRAGMVTELDLQQAKSILEDTKSRLPALEIDARQARNALAVLVGTTPEGIESLVDGDELIPTPPQHIAAGIPAQLLQRRPDIRRALYQTAAQSARIGVAMADLYPHLSIAGSIGLESSGSTLSTNSGGGGKIFSSDSFNYFVGPNFAWSLWNYGRIQNRVRVEYARFYELVSNYQNAVLLAYRDVENGLITFSKSHDRVEYLEASSKAAERSVDLARTQYVEGIADYTRVLNTEQVMLDSQERLAIARGDIALGLIATYRALGGGWCRQD